MDFYHAREPLYSKSAVIAWWSQSTSGKNVHLAVEKGNKFLNISLLRVFLLIIVSKYIQLCICVTIRVWAKR